MKTVKVTQGQFRVLKMLTRKDLITLKKYPAILAESRQLLRACKKIMKRISELSEHASRRKRQTAYKRIIAICKNAVERVEK